MPKLFFVPSRHGYHFTNSFINRIFPGVIPGVSTGGLCGGMVMSALDYWRAGVPIPLHSSDTDDFGPTKLPDEASRMRRYIYDRQLHSLTTKLMASRWIVVGYGPNDFHEWATGSEFEIIKAQIRLGRPAILGLWSMDGDPLRGHQVLCYGYEDFTKKLYVYDPNRPDEESILEPISPENGVEIKGTQKRTSPTTYRGYFFADVYFWDQQPPYDPPYKDLVVSGELSISPQNPDNPTVGESLNCSVTISNIGEYPSRFKHLYIWVRDPQGKNVDNLLGGPERGISVLQPGESRTISRSSQDFGNTTGTYTIGVSYLSNSNHWINIPPEYSSLKNTASITLWKPSGASKLRIGINESVAIGCMERANIPCRKNILSG